MLQQPRRLLKSSWTSPTGDLQGGPGELTCHRLCAIRSRSVHADVEERSASAARTMPTRPALGPADTVPNWGELASSDSTSSPGVSDETGDAQGRWCYLPSHRFHRCALSRSVLSVLAMPLRAFLTEGAELN